MSDGASQVVVGDENGRVFLRFPDPKAWIAFDPDNARLVAEAMARAAYKAHYGRDAPADRSVLGQQVKARVTDEIHDTMVQRIALMLNSMRENRQFSNGQLALILVDRIFSDVL